MNTDTEIKYISSSYKGVPELIDSYGNLNNLLKVVLNEGFNKQKVIDNYIDNNRIILTLDLNHGYIKNQVIILEGSLETSFNKEYRILESSATTIVVYTDSENSIIPVEDFLNIKVAPLGYTIPYENEEEGVICFKNKSLKSPGILKVIDKLPPNGYNLSWAKYARVVIGNSIDTTTGLFIDNNKAPYHNKYPDIELTGDGIMGEEGIHGFAKWDYAIYKSNSNFTEHSVANGDYPTDWRIIGDGNTFYLMIRPMGKNNFSFNILGFGNYVSDHKEETLNICLQARYGLVKAKEAWFQTYVNSGCSFGALDVEYSGFLLANIYNKIKNTKDYGSYQSEGLMLSSDTRYQPWNSSQIVNLNPITGKRLTSKLLIKDSDNTLRGRHRGIEIFYGTVSLPDESFIDNGLVLNIQEPQSTSTSTNKVIPIYFSMKNWEQLD